MENWISRGEITGEDLAVYYMIRNIHNGLPLPFVVQENQGYQEHLYEILNWNPSQPPGREQAERMHEYRIWIEGKLLLGSQNIARYYQQDQATYLEAGSRLPAELKTQGNIALLVGCLSETSARGFVETVRMISPCLRPVIMDLAGISAPAYIKSQPDADFIFADANHMPFATGSIALINTHYLLSGHNQATPMEPTTANSILKEIARIAHPQGVIALVEER